MDKTINTSVTKIKEPSVTREQLAEIDQRVAAYYAKPEKGISWQEVKVKIKIRP